MTPLELIVYDDLDLRAETKRKYLRAVKEFLAFSGGELSHARLEDWRNHLLRAGQHPKSVTSLLYGVRFASRALSLRDGAPDWAQAVASPRVRTTDDDLDGRRVAISFEDVQKIVGVCVDGTVQGVRDRAILLLGFLCGMRRQGIADLQIRDYRTDPKTSSKSLTITLKGGNRHRFIPDDVVGGAIETWIQVLESSWITQGSMFWGLDGERWERSINGDDVYRIVKTRAAQAGIAKISPHVMRHTFISHMVAAGVPAYRIQQITGQKSEAMIRLYTSDVGDRPASSVLADRLR